MYFYMGIFQSRRRFLKRFDSMFLAAFLVIQECWQNETCHSKFLSEHTIKIFFLFWFLFQVNKSQNTTFISREGEIRFPRILTAPYIASICSILLMGSA